MPTRRAPALVVAAALAWAVFLLAGSVASGASTARVSLSSTGGEMHNPFGGFPLQDPVLSADGRFVAFATAAGDLVSNDTNALEDVFVRDRRTGETMRVSVASGSGGSQGAGGSFQPSISADGRFVAFKSYAANLVDDDKNGMPDAFVRDRLTNTTERVSVRDGGANAGAPGRETWEPRISADGSVVVFLSNAPDLVANDTNDKFDIFAFRRGPRQIERVSTTSSGQELGLDSGHPDVSGDGRYVVFESAAPFAAVDPTDADGELDVFVKDRSTGAVSLASSDANGRNTTGYAGRPSISDDGSVVVLESESTLLVSPDANGTVRDVFLKKRSSGEVLLVSRNSVSGQATGGSLAAAVDATGRRVAFESDASNLVTPDPPTRDVYLRDTSTNTTERVSVDSGGSSSGNAILPSLNATGRYVAFQSGGKLEAADANGQDDVYLRDTGGNLAPTAAFDVSSPTPGSIMVDATPSTDSDGWIDAYRYTFGDGTEATGGRGPHAYATAGSYTVTLTVTDQDGATATAVKAVTVGSAQPLVAPPVGGPQTNPLPIAAAAARPELLKAASVLRPDRRGRVGLKLRCPPAATATCSGHLVLLLPAKGKRKAVTLGSASFSVAPGRTATVLVPLSANARRMLSKKGRLTVLALARAGANALASRSIVLSKPTPRRRNR